MTPHVFLPFAVGWLPTLIVPLLLWPRIGTGLLRLWRPPPPDLANHAEWPTAFVMAATVWALSDRLWFVGDFVMRQGSPGSDVIATGSFFQSMPLDTFLHRTLPEMLNLRTPMKAGPYSRALGSLGAGVFGWIVVRFARLLEFRGAAWWCFVTGALSGGYLTVFTGLGKASGEMCVLLPLSAYFAIKIIRQGSGHVGLALTQVAALLVHRSAIALLPVCLVAWWRWSRSASPINRRTQRRWMIGPALIVASLAVIGPRIVSLITTFDLVHHLRPAIASDGLADGGFQTLVRTADILNILIAMSPWLLIGVALLTQPMPTVRVPDAKWVFGTLAATCFPVFIMILPQQGIFRDWDVFAFAGVALSLLCAYVVAEHVSTREIPRWVIPGLLAAAVVPSLQWLAINHDPVSGLTRVRRFVEQAPTRPAATQAMTWDFLANHSFRIGDWKHAAIDARHAVEQAPHPRLLILWGLAEVQVGDYESAYRAFDELTERAPENPIGWLGLAGQSARLKRHEDFQRAVAVLKSYPPNSTKARLVRGFVLRFPMVLPESMSDPRLRPSPPAPR